MMKEQNFLIYYSSRETILLDDDKISFCIYIPLMPKNTYGNSINAQHVATTDRRAKYIG